MKEIDILCWFYYNMCRERQKLIKVSTVLILERRQIVYNSTNGKH